MGDIYYVYKHVDPFSKEIVYIGMGHGARAYIVATNPPQKNSNRISSGRKPDHSKYLYELMNEGFLPHEWVIFEAKCLSNHDARKLESRLIKKHKPKFNLVRRGKFSDEQLQNVFKERLSGKTHKQVAEATGIPEGTITSILLNDCIVYTRNVPKEMVEQVSFLKFKKSSLSLEDEDTIINAFYNLKMTIQQIHKQFGYSRYHIKTLIDRDGSEINVVYIRPTKDYFYG